MHELVGFSKRNLLTFKTLRTNFCEVGLFGGGSPHVGMPRIGQGLGPFGAESAELGHRGVEDDAESVRVPAFRIAQKSWSFARCHSGEAASVR